MIVSSVTFVCIIVAFLPVTQTTTVALVNRVATIPAQIRASKIHVDRTPYVPCRIIELHALVLLEWYRAQRQQSVACAHRHYLARKIVDVLPATAASTNCVDRCAPAILRVSAMNDANVDRASHCVVVTMTAGTVKFAKVSSARLDVVRTTTVPIIYRASISNVSIHAWAVQHAERTLNAVALIM